MTYFLLTNIAQKRDVADSIEGIEEIEESKKKVKNENLFSSEFMDPAQWNLLLTLTQDPLVNHIGVFWKFLSSQYL